jgi:2-dehydro-3-deoxy-D-arabinonate dehydratase
MKLFRTSHGPVAGDAGNFHRITAATWDDLLARPDILTYLQSRIATGDQPQVDEPTHPLAPIEAQEIWAAGVTYLRSKIARMEESKSSAGGGGGGGGGDFYDRVYSAPRPELFYKASAHRVAGPGRPIRIRKDSRWNVPEPELTLLISATGRITGYTIGNDVSSRDIEGENPLYLPQAKVYDGSAALGPCLLLTDAPLPPETSIELEIRRNGARAFAGRTEISRIKRELASLAEYLYRECSFPAGCFLMTGTGIVPPDSFTLSPGDEVLISIAPIGTLSNWVQ